MAKEKTVKLYFSLLLFAAILASSFYIFAGPFIEIVENDLYCCTITASSKNKITYFYGLYRKTEYRKSPLKQWCQKNGFSLQHRWKYYGTTTDYIAGRSFACGDAPPIYDFPFKMQELFLQKNTREEIIEFIEKMQNSSVEEQKRTVEKTINEKIW